MGPENGSEPVSRHSWRLPVALSCPHCTVLLTRSEAQERRCPSCGKTFTEAIEESAGPSAEFADRKWKQGPCDFRGKETSLKSCYLKVSFMFFTSTLLVFTQRWRGWCNIRCAVCQTCRWRVNIWPWVYGFLILMSAPTCFGPPLIFGATEDDKRSILRVTMVVSAAMIVLIVALLLTQGIRYRRVLGTELYQALLARFGSFNMYFISNLPHGEGSTSASNVIKESTSP